MPPTATQIDRLLAYVPVFTAPGFAPVLRWEGGKQPDGSITLPYPAYAPEVNAFFGEVAAGGWLDVNYDPNQAAALLGDVGAVAAATWDQLRQMLTYCTRGERFADGHWATLLENGSVLRLLARLQVLRRELVLP